MKESTHDLLLRSFDSSLSAEEFKRLDETLKNSEPLRREKEHFILMREMIGKQESVRFKPFFAERVMNRILKEKMETAEDFFSALHSLFRPIMVASVVLILVMVSFNALKKHVIVSTTLSSNDVSLEEVFDPTVEW